ncbi:hypothetical protein F5884DRAFT_898497 [Xylogone sp. PMI_703]|nr:hypothetical protein F5884DRAFT_898497 [Xylogone sp. PMI_703]
MGQRHQLFVIAKVGTYYRSLAAVHHQWLWGIYPLYRCLRLLRIFSNEANKVAIKQELIFAAEYYRNKEPPPTERPQFPSWEAARSGPCPFPFITTCLMVGSASDEVDDYPYAVHEQPFGVGYDQGDNNDGITVLDITDVNNIRYCFVNYSEPFELDDDEGGLEPGAEADERRRMRNKLHQPLSGWEYLLCYYKRSSSNVQDNISASKALDKYPLVKLEALNDTWPYGSWNVTATVEESLVHCQLAPKQTPSLQEQTIRKMVDSALDSEDFDLATWEDPLQYIQGFQQSLRQEITRNYDRIGLSYPSIMLLALAYPNQAVLDLSPFPNFRADYLKALLSSKEFSDVTTVNVSEIAAIQSPTDLWDALSVIKKLKCVYILDKPGRESDDAGVQIFRALATSHPGLAVEKLVISAQFSRAVRRSSWLPTLRAGPVLAAFPAVQLLIRHEDSSRYGMRYPFEYFDLADSLVNPVRLVTGLFKYLECLANRLIPRWDGTGVIVSYCFALSSPLLGDNQPLEISSLPPETYRWAKNAHFYGGEGCYSIMRDLLQGEWTILVVRVNQEDEDNNLVRLISLKYAFIRSKIAISSNPSSESYIKVKPEDLEIFDAAGFLQQAAPNIDRSQLQYHFDALQERFSKTRHTRAIGRKLLSFLEKGEVCALLDQFISNVPVVREANEEVSSRAREFGF